jgi:hypothetical protein
MANTWSISKVNYDINLLFLHFGKDEQKIDNGTLQQNAGKGDYESIGDINHNLLARAVRENKPAVIAYNSTGSAWGSYDYYTGSKALESLKKGDKIDVVSPTGSHTRETVQYVQTPG